MVLIAVLWMVAALSILVTGITRSVREETRVLSLSRQGVEGGALGNAAINLVLQGIAASSTPVTRLTEVEVVFRGVSMHVQIIPLNGLIDINGASNTLLASLFTVAGGLPADQAAALAQATIDTRIRKDARGQQERFDAIEDLLRVPGIDYTLYAKLSGLVTPDVRSGGKVNPLAAPQEVLAVLAGGNTGEALRIAASRSAGQEGIDTTTLDAGATTNVNVQRFRIDAKVPLSDGMLLNVSRTVDFSPRSLNGLPWRTFYSQRGFESPLRNSR
jgi:general secretion pathway protein K